MIQLQTLLKADAINVLLQDGNKSTGNGREVACNVDHMCDTVTRPALGQPPCCKMSGVSREVVCAPKIKDTGVPFP